MHIHAIRLLPGQDLKQELLKFTESKEITAGCILTCVGSLQQVCLRLANQDKSETYPGKFEIIGLTGTLSQDGVHLHIGVADTSGKMTGGHLMAGSLIYTTAEIVIGEIDHLIFDRKLDESTSYNELFIRKSS